MKKAKTGLVVVSAVLVGALSVSTTATGSQGRSHQVALKNISFRPDVLRIRRGDRVTWTWRDKAIDTDHNVTSFGRRHFRGASTRYVGTYTVRFTKPGVYYYHCTIHPLAMHGRIVVR